MSEKPKLYSDFGAHLLDVIDLKIKNSDFTYSTAEFHDRIKPNHKYYYLFRVLNENRTPGYPSQVYEAELIDDGGYTYTNFKVLYPKDLIEDPFVKPIKKFKKLFQLQPNMSHMTLNTTDANFSMPASTQLENVHIGSSEDLIWDKTFKLRLTSKKTGKKIDLNITYNLNSE